MINCYAIIKIVFNLYKIQYLLMQQLSQESGFREPKWSIILFYILYMLNFLILVDEYF